LHSGDLAGSQGARPSSRFGRSGVLGGVVEGDLLQGGLGELLAAVKDGLDAVIPIGALARYDRPAPALTGYDQLLSRSIR